jgi:hypothetical protein
MFPTCRHDGICIRDDCKFNHPSQQKYNIHAFTIPCKYESLLGSCAKEKGKCTFKHNNLFSKCEEELRRDKEKTTPYRPESKFPDFIQLVSKKASLRNRERSKSPSRDSLQRKRERSKSPSRDSLQRKRERSKSPSRDSLQHKSKRSKYPLHSMKQLVDQIVVKYSEQKHTVNDLERKHKELENKAAYYEQCCRDYQEHERYNTQLTHNLQETVSINEHTFGKYQDNDTANKIQIACLEQQVKELTEENTNLKLKI